MVPLMWSALEANCIHCGKNKTALYSKIPSLLREAHTEQRAQSQGTPESYLSIFEKTFFPFEIKKKSIWNGKIFPFEMELFFLISINFRIPFKKTLKNHWFFINMINLDHFQYTKSTKKHRFHQNLKKIIPFNIFPFQMDFFSISNGKNAFSMIAE